MFKQMVQTPLLNGLVMCSILVVHYGSSIKYIMETLDIKLKTVSFTYTRFLASISISNVG